MTAEYIEVTEETATESSYIDPIVSTIPLDIFYPFMIASKSTFMISSVLISMVLFLTLIFY